MASFTIDQVVEATRASVLECGKDSFKDIVTDTRKITLGCLFVALKGERFNGESFVAEAVLKGASGVLVSSDYKPDKELGATVFKAESDTQSAYQLLAAWWRRQFDIPVIAITGSNGKTTTKDLTAAVLSSRLKVLKTQANFNNEIGLPLTLLQLNEEHEAAVVEIGMRGLNQISALAPVAEPDIGIITNVGETHMEILGSIENIAKAKSEMAEAIKPGGTVIINSDNPYTAAMSEKVQPGVRVITFGIENDADVKACDIESGGNTTIFKCRLGKSGVMEEYTLPMAGRHNVYNALAAIAAGWALKLASQEIKQGLQGLEMTGMRFEFQKAGSYTVINDAYNASPMSMAAALSTLPEVVKGRYAVVLGDMLELGEVSKEAHFAAGRQAASSGAFALVAFGSLARDIAAGASAAGMKSVYTADSHHEVANILHEILSAGDTVLLKGSRGMKMEKIIDLL